MIAPNVERTEPHLDLDTLLAMMRESAGIVWADENDEEPGDPAGCGGAGGAV